LDSEESAKRVEFKFPLLMLRTRKFIRVYEKLGALRITGVGAWIGLYVVPIIATVGIFFIGVSLFATLSQPQVREVSRQVGPEAYLLLPGLNPFLPVLYGWLGIVVGVLVHEGAHGVIARRLGYGVKSSGLLFFLILPIGAFVELNEDEIKIAKGRDSGRILAAGPSVNALVGVVSLLLLISLASSVTPRLDGLFIDSVEKGFPAELAGVKPGDVLLRFDGTPVTRVEGLVVLLSEKSVGDTVTLDLNRGFGRDQYRVSLTLVKAIRPDDPLPKMGVNVIPLLISDRLQTYRQLAMQQPLIHFIPPSFPGVEGIVPYSDQLVSFYESPLGPFFQPVANTLYWIWFVNINLAIFNSLPIYPLDGGKMFRVGAGRLLSRFGGDRIASYLSNVLTGAMVLSILLLVTLPYLLA